MSALLDKNVQKVRISLGKQMLNQYSSNVVWRDERTKTQQEASQKLRNRLKNMHLPFNNK